MKHFERYGLKYLLFRIKMLYAVSLTDNTILQTVFKVILKKLQRNVLEQENNFLFQEILTLIYYLIPTIDKPARVRNNSATLIVNIFVNNPEQGKISGTNRRAFCMRMRQYGLLKCHRGIFCELFTFITSICRLFSGAE